MFRFGRLGLAGWVLATAVACRSGPSAPPTQPRAVQATSFALAEMVRRVGLNRVTVSDHGPIIAIGLQPWLDPVAVEGVPALVASWLTGQDRAGRSAFAAAARAYQAQLEALEIDYRSSLADCARHDLVTADAAFAPMAARYGFADHPAGEAGVDSVVRSRQIPVLFTETGRPTAAVLAVARATHARVDQLDTMLLRTPSEAARGATYLSLMTDNLAKLRVALACAS